MNIFIAFLLALVTYYINHRLHRIMEIKIAINTLFEIYGTEQALGEHDNKDVASKLMDEIVAIEKRYDCNPCIHEQVSKLKKLRLLYYFRHNTESTLSFDEELTKIGFRRLGRAFIILAYLNIS